jgi:hypothetical protein
MSWHGLRRATAARQWLMLVMLLAPGCAKEEMPKTYAVKGKVVSKNGKPYTSGQITFMSVADPELRGYGTIEKDGTFTLDTIALTKSAGSERLPGAVEGEFKVNIRPGSGNDSQAPPVFAGKAAFTLKKTYKIEAKENNELTIVVE